MSSPRTKDHVILVSAQVLGLDFGTLDFSLGLDIHNYNIVVKSEKLDLAYNTVKPKEWYFVLDWVRFRTELACVRLTNQIFWLDGSKGIILGTQSLSF